LHANVQLSFLEEKILELLEDSVRRLIPSCPVRICQEHIAAGESTPYYSILHIGKSSSPYRLSVNQGVILELRLFGKSGAPIQCLLHTENGMVSEIEIFCADAGPLPLYMEIERYETLM